LGVLLTGGLDLRDLLCQRIADVFVLEGCNHVRMDTIDLRLRLRLGGLYWLGLWVLCFRNGCAEFVNRFRHVRLLDRLFPLANIFQIIGRTLGGDFDAGVNGLPDLVALEMQIITGDVLRLRRGSLALRLPLRLRASRRCRR
jgi:hypothetical protein